MSLFVRPSVFPFGIVSKQATNTQVQNALFTLFTLYY